MYNEHKRATRNWLCQQSHPFLTLEGAYPHKRTKLELSQQDQRTNFCLVCGIRIQNFKAVKFLQNPCVFAIETIVFFGSQINRETLFFVGPIVVSRFSFSFALCRRLWALCDLACEQAHLGSHARVICERVICERSACSQAMCDLFCFFGLKT